MALIHVRNTISALSCRSELGTEPGDSALSPMKKTDLRKSAGVVFHASPDCASRSSTFESQIPEQIFSIQARVPFGQSGRCADQFALAAAHRGGSTA